MAYQVEGEPLIECVRGSVQDADGTTEYAFAAIKRREPINVKLSEMPPDMMRQKTPQGDPIPAYPSRAIETRAELAPHIPQEFPLCQARSGVLCADVLDRARDQGLLVVECRHRPATM